MVGRTGDEVGLEMLVGNHVSMPFANQVPSIDAMHVNVGGDIEMISHGFFWH